MSNARRINSRAAKGLRIVAECMKAPGSDQRSRHLLHALAATCEQGAIDDASPNMLHTEIIVACAHAIAILIRETGPGACGTTECHCREAQTEVNAFARALGILLEQPTVDVVARVTVARSTDPRSKMQ